MTKAQERLLFYIEQFSTENNGVCPSFEEMKVFMGLRSKSAIHRIVLALEERGHIRRLPNRARSIEVIKSIYGCCPRCGQTVPSLAPAFAA